MIGCEHILFTIGLSRFLSPLLAVLVGVLLYVATTRRFIAQMRDTPRPRWITRLVDLPLFWHFGAAATTLLASPLCVGAALLLGLLRGRALTFVLPAWRDGIVSCYAFGLLVSGWAIWVERRLVQIRRLTVNVEDLPPELEGYTIAQLSDIHVGSFDPKERAIEWAAMANALAPDLAVVTGDLVTAGEGFYRDAADAIAALRAKDGVLVITGNHDLHNDDELVRLVNEGGPLVLKNDSRIIRRGNAELFIAGMDAWHASSADVKRVLRDRPEGAPCVLLCHYPTAFEAAVETGVDLLLTGHTHGGQLAVPFFSEQLNFAKLTNQRSRGPVYSGKTLMYVNAGLGTTGPPMRLAVPPEIALFTLRRASSG